MAQHNETGALGEKLARHFLEKKGYRILETNWRFKRAEIDLIAMQEKVMVFIEVKTRSYDYFGQPEEFITQRKQDLLADAAGAYMEQSGHDWEIRFDVISIILRNGQDYDLEHFEDFFLPGM